MKITKKEEINRKELSVPKRKRSIEKR